MAEMTFLRGGLVFPLKFMAEESQPSWILASFWLLFWYHSHPLAGSCWKGGGWLDLSGGGGTHRKPMASASMGGAVDRKGKLGNQRSSSFEV